MDTETKAPTIPEFRTNNDPELKYYFKRFLESKGYTDVKLMPGFREYDIEATAPGGDPRFPTIHRFELKNRCWRRPTRSDKYGDVIIEFKKFIKLCDHRKHTYVVNFFEDAFYIVHIYVNPDIKKYNCPKTVYWGGERLDKELCCWPLEVCKRIEYEDL